jgi:hypothetical protein
MLDFSQTPKFNEGSFNITGSRYTIKLCQLHYNNFNYWNPDPDFIDPFDNWNLYSDEYKQSFKEYFYHYFYFHEIASETPFIFAIKLNNEMHKLSPYYSQLLSIEALKIKENINFMLPNWQNINTDSTEQVESIKKILVDLKIDIDQLQKQFEDSNKNSNSTNDNNTIKDTTHIGNNTSDTNTINDIDNTSKSKTKYDGNTDSTTTYGKVTTLGGTDTTNNDRYQVTVKNKNDGEITDTYEDKLEGTNQAWDRGKTLNENTTSDSPQNGYVYDVRTPSDPNSDNVGSSDGEWSGSSYISAASRSKGWYNPYMVDGEPEGAISKSTSKLKEIQDRLDNETDPDGPLVNRVSVKTIGDGNQSITTYGTNGSNNEYKTTVDYGQTTTESGQDNVNTITDDTTTVDSSYHTDNDTQVKNISNNEYQNNDNTVSKSVNVNNEQSNSNKEDNLDRSETHVTDTKENDTDNKVAQSATYSKTMENVYESISDARDNILNIYQLICNDLRNLFLRVW